MEYVKIINSQKIILSDKNSAYKISNTGKHSSAIIMEPSKNYWFSTQEEIIGSEIKGLFVGEPGDAWELYGSDHNTVNIFYGLTKDIEKIENKLEDKIEEIISSLEISDFDNDLIIFSKWNFPDDTSLIIIHLDSQNYNYNFDNLNLKNSNLITVVAGAQTDDIVLEQIVGAQAAKFLSKFKTVGADVEEIECFIEDGIEYADENLKYNNSKINNKSKDLFLNMAYHLFNNIVDFSQNDEENNPIVTITKKLNRYFEISKLSPPIGNEITELQFVDDNSNKYGKNK